MPRACVAVLCFALLPLASGRAQSLAIKDPEAITLAQRSLAAMGAAAILVAEDSVARGTLTFHAANIKEEKTVPVIVKTKGSKLVRVELQRASGTTVRILNNGKATIQRPDGTVRRLLMNNTLGERVSHVPVLSLLAEHQSPTVELTKPSKALVAGQMADSITLSVIPTDDPEQADDFRTQTRTTFFVDQATSLISKVQYTLAAENDPNVVSQTETVFSDYREVKGLLVPLNQKNYVDGKLESELVLDSIEFGVGISDSEFALSK